MTGTESTLRGADGNLECQCDVGPCCQRTSFRIQACKEALRRGQVREFWLSKMASS